jgi:hypothetical protein
VVVGWNNIVGFGFIHHFTIQKIMELNDLLARISTLSTAVASARGDVLYLGGLDLLGEMLGRIFNDGKDSTDKPIGKYKSKSWIKTRSLNGRQTGFVDLQFTGDLFNSIQVVKRGNDVFIAIINDDDYNKAIGNEKRRKKTIFLPTENERDNTEKYINDLFEDEFLKAFNKL